MIFERTDNFKKQFKKLPLNIQKKLEKKLLLLASDFRHPSLHTKKEKGKEGVWEARIDRFYRFTFTMAEDLLALRTVGPHDDALK